MNLKLNRIGFVDYLFNIFILIWNFYYNERFCQINYGLYIFQKYAKHKFAAMQMIVLVMTENFIALRIRSI